MVKLDPFTIEGKMKVWSLSPSLELYLLLIQIQFVIHELVFREGIGIESEMKSLNPLQKSRLSSTS